MRPAKLSQLVVWLIGIFIAVTGPDNIHVLINSDQIVSLREPRGQDRVVHKDAKCIVFLTDGKFIAVIEECEKVQALISEVKNED